MAFPPGVVPILGSGPPTRLARNVSPTKTEVKLKNPCIPADKAVKDLHETVVILVGSEKKAFHVPKALLYKSSKFFRTAMKPEWDAHRVQPGTIDLTDEDLQVFEWYLHWHYFRTLPVLSNEDGRDMHLIVEEETGKLIKCYLLGDKVMDPAFKNAVIDGYIIALRIRSDNSRHFPTVGGVEEIYACTTENSPLRKLCVDIFAAVPARNWEAEVASWPREFTNDMVKKLSNGAPIEAFHFGQDTKKYHEEVE